MTTWMEPFAFWLADVYLAATILLLATAAIFALMKQPALRMAVAWGNRAGNSAHGVLLPLIIAAAPGPVARAPRRKQTGGDRERRRAGSDRGDRHGA